MNTARGRASVIGSGISGALSMFKCGVLRGIHMICFRFYPQWNYERIELWLAEMERQGYRP